MERIQQITFAVLLVACIIVCLLLTGCSSTPVEDQQTSPASMFVKVEETGGWDVLYHRETKVMYVVSTGVYNYGTFTLLVNADGTPMLWED